MHCTSCGAEYGEKELNCPYCGSENRKLAEELRQELLEGYDREAEAMEITVPGQALRHFTKRLVRLISVVLLISVVFAVGSGIYARVSAKPEYRTKQKNLKRMETLFQEADWEGLEESGRLSAVEYCANAARYTDMAFWLNLDMDYEPEFDWMWERLQMYACRNRYRMYAAAEESESSCGKFAGKARAWRQELIKLCTQPECPENEAVAAFWLEEVSGR